MPLIRTLAPVRELKNLYPLVMIGSNAVLAGGKGGTVGKDVGEDDGDCDCVGGTAVVGYGDVDMDKIGTGDNVVELFTSSNR